MQKAVIFVDGENFRHSLKHLFPSEFEYLPKSVKWRELFTAALPSDFELIRIYWYAVLNLDFRPHYFPRDYDRIEKILKKHSGYRDALSEISGEIEKHSFIDHAIGYMEYRRKFMEKRFKGWHTIHAAIASDEKYLEFRHAGSIPFNLLDDELEREKGIDVKLAVDLLSFRDIYDLAIIFSGDQDYIPAICYCKDRGKHVFSVNFTTSSGKLLPGSAYRLKSICDEIRTLEYDQVKVFINEF